MIIRLFSKTEIKLTKTRLDAIKRKRNAMQKFLKRDIADLLSNGLDINAYGRVIITSSAKFNLNFIETLFSRFKH